MPGWITLDPTGGCIFKANLPLHPCKISIPMTCSKDLIFNVLYNKNEQLLTDLLEKSSIELNVPWATQFMPLETKQVLFFLLLHKDLKLKQQTLTGMKNIGIDPLLNSKAERFFLALEGEIINPWLSDERHSKKNF